MAIVDATHDDVEQLLALARSGQEGALGRLLAQFEPYLTLLARLQIGKVLQGKVDPADLVQDTFLEAHKHFPNFRGGTEPEWTSWLRQILAGRVGVLVRRYVGTKGRDVRLERQIEQQIDESSRSLGPDLIAQQSSPSQQAARREQAVLLANALAQLPPDYREAIVLRNLEQHPFAEVARRMGRSEDSVQKLWLRGLGKLRRILGGEA